MSDFEIRKFHHSDIPHLMEVCLKTGNDGSDGTDLYSDAYFIGHLYVLPYLVHNPELCLVVETDNIPVGYILGTDNTKNLYLWMDEYYFPPLRKRYPANMKCASPVEEFFLSRLHTDRSNINYDIDYPGHLHINLLPIAQGKGLGSKLIDLFLEQLSEEGTPGVYLHTGSQNTKAIKFYLKKGFQIVEENPGSVKLTKPLLVRK